MQHRHITLIVLSTMLLFGAIDMAYARESAMKALDDVSPLPSVKEHVRFAFTGLGVDLADMSLAVRAMRVSISEGLGFVDLGFGDGSVNFDNAQDKSQIGGPELNAGIAPSVMLRFTF